MLAAPLDLEAAALQSLASRYREEGYEVVVEPRGSELPEALRQFRPDLLARRGDELVVAEVKRRRPGGTAWREVERLAEVTRTVPHARFDLVVLDDAADGTEAASRDWSADEIQRALADVEKLVEEKRTAPAILLLFAALEPQLRAMAAAESVFVPGTRHQGANQRPHLGGGHQPQGLPNSDGRSGGPKRHCTWTAARPHARPGNLAPPSVRRPTAGPRVQGCAAGT